MANDAAQLSRDFLAMIRAGMTVRGITEAELSRLVFRQKGTVANTLNMVHGCPVTLRTMAKLANAVGLRIVIKLEPML